MEVLFRAFDNQNETCHRLGGWDVMSIPPVGVAVLDVAIHFLNLSLRFQLLG